MTHITPEEVLAHAHQIQESLARLRHTISCAVMFVDLAGSTEFKDRNPSEEVWLPRLAAFLGGVTKVVAQHGRVVKYIGDEVMAVFEGSNAVLNAEHAAEAILSFCLTSQSFGFRAKVGIDHGAVSMLDFRGVNQQGTHILGDPQGLVVDRCARITARALPNTALASSEFVRLSQIPKRWRKAGVIKAKGIGKPVGVSQLEFASNETPRVSIGEDLTLDDCRRELFETRQMLEQLKQLRG